MFGEENAVEISIVAIFGFDEHIAHDRLADPCAHSLDLIPPVDESFHFVLAANHERDFRSTFHRSRRGIVCDCGFDESLGRRPEGEHELELTFRRGNRLCRRAGSCPACTASFGKSVRGSGARTTRWRCRYRNIPGVVAAQRLDLMQFTCEWY